MSVTARDARPAGLGFDHSSDRRIGRELESGLASVIPNGRIRVHVERGCAVLIGWVTSTRSCRLATLIADDYPGIRMVKNRLVVRPSAGRPAPEDREKPMP